MCETSNDYNLDKRQLKDSWLLMERRFKSLQISLDCSSRDPLLNFGVSSRHLNNISIFSNFQGKLFLTLIAHRDIVVHVHVYHQFFFYKSWRVHKNMLWHIKNICPLCVDTRHCTVTVFAAVLSLLRPGADWRLQMVSAGAGAATSTGPSSLQWTPACSTAALQHSLDKVGRISDCNCENRSYLSIDAINCCFAYYEPNEVSKLS